MTLPDMFTLVRHGQSEANVVQQMLKDENKEVLSEAFLDNFLSRHDSNMRLTALGVEQAKSAGDWLRSNGEEFDRFYVSPHTRTRETAANLKLNGDWRVDDRFRERDWGEVQSGRLPSLDSQHNKKLNEWYWKPQGGESMATGVRLRVESVMTSLYRKENINSVMAVVHGEFLRTTQFVLERMTPDAWNVMDKDPAFKVQNAMILQFASRNPNNPDEKARNYRWRRAICPWDETLSWDNGQWVSVDIKKYSDEALMSSVENYARLL